MDRTTRRPDFKANPSLHLHTKAGKHYGALLKTVTLALILAALVFIGVSRGRNAIRAASDKPEAICDPTECRISENKRPANCSCRYSVVLIDLSGKDLELTNVENGVDFDLNSEGSMKQKVSWTTFNSTSAFFFLIGTEMAS